MIGFGFLQIESMKKPADAGFFMNPIASQGLSQATN